MASVFFNYERGALFLYSRFFIIKRDRNKFVQKNLNVKHDPLVSAAKISKLQVLAERVLRISYRVVFSIHAQKPSPAKFFKHASFVKSQIKISLKHFSQSQKRLSEKYYYYTAKNVTLFEQILRKLSYPITSVIASPMSLLSSLIMACGLNRRCYSISSTLATIVMLRFLGSRQFVTLYLAHSVLSSCSQSLSAVLHEPKASTEKISVKEQLFVPVEDFSSAFENSLLLFRGDTDRFRFQLVNTIGVPYLHISNGFDQLSDIRIYNRIESVNLTRTICKSVKQQMIVVSLSKISADRYENTYSSHINEMRTVIPVYPQTLIVLNSISWSFKSSIGFGEMGGLFGVFAKSGPLISYLFNYNTDNGKRKEAYILCHFCQYKQYMELLSLEPIVPGEEEKSLHHFSIKFDWNGGDAKFLMEKVRSNITDEGRNLIWQLPRHITKKYGSSRRIIQGDEMSNPGIEPSSRSSILGMENIELAVIKVLFPMHPSTHTISCGLITDCESQQMSCNKQNILLPCANRGLRGFKPGPYEYPILQFSRISLGSDDVIFITSEKLQQSKSDSMSELFLGIFEYPFWILLCICMVILSIILAFSPKQNNLLQQNLTTCKQPSCFTWMFYLGCALVAQYPRDLVSSNRSGNVVLLISQALFISWTINALFISTWYTAFMKSSFNFPFPYELRLKDWRDFENFSLYLMVDEKKSSSSKNRLNGAWFYESQRKRMLDDVNNFEDRYWDQYPLPTTYSPIRHEMIPIQFYEFQNEFVEKPSKGDPFNRNLRPGSYNYRPIMNWVSVRRLWNNFCGRNSQESSQTGAHPRPSCMMDRKSLLRMHYRLDVIDYTDLYMYVGHWYQNLTRNGRAIGLELIQKLGNRSVLRDETYRNGLKKLNHVFRSDKVGHGNTLYWMLRRREAAFVTTKAEFPWHWNQFKKLMKKDKSIRFAHTGSKELNVMGTDGGTAGDKCESLIQIKGPWFRYMPEMKWMAQRIRTMEQSGIVGFLAKWDMSLRPPIKEKLNEFIEETATGFQALSMQHDSVKATFIMNAWLIAISGILFLLELSISALVV